MSDEDVRYSRAFDNMVQGEDDVVGLLAYALYKRAIREDAQLGQHLHGEARRPSPTVVTAYRQSAERMLQDLVKDNLRRAAPELEQSAMLAAIENTRLDLRGYVDQRTGQAARER